MRRYARLLGRLCLVSLAFAASGCTEIYFAFGPGGIWGPQQTQVGGTTTTRPSVIASPTFLTSQLDPTLEATAGAKVIVPAQLNDDNLDGVIDGNDLIDLVSGSNESQPIQIHLNNGGGTSFTTLTIAGGGPVARMVDIEIADIDRDGRNDVAVLINDTGFTPVTGANLRGAVVLLFNPADPANPLAWQQVTLTATFVLPSDEEGMTDFALGDMNGDSLPDVVLGSNESGDVEKFIRLYINPGPDPGAGPHLSRNGGAWIESTNPVGIDAVRFKSMGLADIDGDGDLDIVASFPIAKTFNIRWMVNPLIPAGAAAATNGNWTRRILGQQSEVDPENSGADFIALGDIDGDGDTDVAAAHANLGLVQWFRNPAQPAVPGGFDVLAQQSFPWEVFNLGSLNTGFIINQLQLADLDANGELDCFLTASGSMVGLQRGLVLEDFWLAFTITQTNPTADIGRCAIVDLHGDGLIDIVAPLDRDGLVQDQILVFRRF